MMMIKEQLERLEDMSEDEFEESFQGVEPA